MNTDHFQFYTSEYSVDIIVCDLGVENYTFKFFNILESISESPEPLDLYLK